MTKDEVVEQIDTVLHTDLLNEVTRNQVIKDINGLLNTPGDIIKAIQIANNNEDSNFLDNLVGTIRSTDSDMNNTLTMGKKYKELKERTDLSPDEKAAQALILANQSANGMRENFGIDNDVPILVLFADESKGDEAGAFLREDGMMVIFLDPSKIDMSDAKQVYNGLMYEMNHYNPSNPYVYDKKEGEVNKGTALHNQEEGFTSIGRKDISGEGNQFYDEILKGSNVLITGNGIYSSLEEDQLDYISLNPMDAIKWGSKKVSNGIKYVGNKAGQGVKAVGNATGNSVAAIGKGAGKVVGVFNEDAGKKVETGSKNLGNKVITTSNKTSNKITKTTNTIANVVNLEDSKIVQQTEEYRNKYDGISTIDLGIAAAVVTKNPDLKGKVENKLDTINEFSLIDHRIVEDPTQWAPWMALAGSGLIQMPDGKAKAAGIALMVPQGIISAASAYNRGKSGDYEGAIQDGALSLSLFMLSGMAVQDSKGLLTQTTGKNNSKFFSKGDGIYTLENGTSEGYLSGNNFVRVNYVNGVATNAYGRIDGNTLMLDRTSVGAVPGTSLISSGITNVLGLPGTSQTSVGSLTYTPTEVRPSQIFISNPVTGVTEVFHNGLSGLIPTYGSPTEGIIYNQHPYYGFYPATDISTLNNTSIFSERALPHILDGDVKVKLDIITGLPKKENVSGYHSNSITGIPTIDSSTIIVDPVTGVYKAKVINPISGTIKGGNQGYSTFFPDNWTAQQKVDAMNEAFNNKTKVPGTDNVYQGTSKEGILIEMYIDKKTNEVISSFPKF